MSEPHKHQKLYNAIYNYGDEIGVTFEEVVALLLNVCDEEHLRRACEVKPLKVPSLPPVKDPITGKWQIPGVESIIADLTNP